MDAFSDVIATLHLSSALYCRSELHGPWGLRFPRRESATFHAVRRGACWLRYEGSAKPVPLTAGDFVVFPGGLAHTISDEPRRPAENIDEVMARHQKTGNGPLILGGDGPLVTLLCGAFQFARSDVHPLLSMLPPMIHVRGDDGRAAPTLEATLELLARETAQERPGASVVINRTTDILFVQMIRAYLEESTPHHEGWLRGLREPSIARALASIHRDPRRAWDLRTLAASAGLSRSAFCARFTELVGEPPHRYLTRWRLLCATEILSRENLALKEVAERVGFQGEVTFSRVFKKYLGVPPAAYRRAGSRLAASGPSRLASADRFGESG